MLFISCLINMKKSINKIASKLWLSKSLSEKLEKELENLSLQEKKQLLKNIHQMYVEKNKYIPQKGILYKIENNILDSMVSDNKKDLANFILLLSFDTLSLKDKMRIELLVWDFIDDDQYPKDAFERNLLSIVDNDFILAAEVYLHYFPSLYEKKNLYDLWKKMRTSVLNEQKPLTLNEIDKLEKEIYSTDWLEISWLSKSVLSSIINQEKIPDDEDSQKNENKNQK